MLVIKSLCLMMCQINFIFFDSISLIFISYLFSHTYSTTYLLFSRQCYLSLLFSPHPYHHCFQFASIFLVHWQCYHIRTLRTSSFSSLAFITPSEFLPPSLHPSIINNFLPFCTLTDLRCSSITSSHLFLLGLDRHSFGSGFAVHKLFVPHIKEFTSVSKRITVLRISSRSIYLTCQNTPNKCLNKSFTYFNSKVKVSKLLKIFFSLSVNSVAYFQFLLKPH